MPKPDFAETKFYQTQAGRILTRLQMSPNKWVPVFDLMAVSGSAAVHTRVDVLRKRGWPIEQETKRRPGDPRALSSYRLVVEPPSAIGHQPSSES